MSSLLSPLLPLCAQSLNTDSNEGRGSFTGDEFVRSVPVGDFSEVSQDLGGFLCLRLQVGRDGVTHCEHTHYTVY